MIYLETVGETVGMSCFHTTPHSPLTTRQDHIPASTSSVMMESMIPSL